VTGSRRKKRMQEGLRRWKGGEVKGGSEGYEGSGH